MNTQELRNAVVALLGPSFAAVESVVIHYGSRKVGRDIDLFVVQQRPASSSSIEVGLLDLAVTTNHDFMRRLQLLDPAVTEPILTGALLCGNVKKWRHYGTTLQASRPTDAGIAFLQSRASEQHRSAREILALGIETGCEDYIAFALQNASWCLSYTSFAKHYECGAPSACSLAVLAEQDKLLLPEFWTYFRRVRNGAERISCDVADRWLDTVSSILGENQRGTCP